MWTLINIASDWVILFTIVIHTWVLWWITSSETHRLRAAHNTGKAIIASGKAVRLALDVTLASTPFVFVAALFVAPWPPSRLTLFIIVTSALHALYRSILPLILRSWKFSIDAHDDFMAWHRMHFSLLEELLNEPAISEDTKLNIQIHMERIRTEYKEKPDRTNKNLTSR